MPAEVGADEWVNRWYRKNHCHHAFAYTGIHVCCCAMCHGDFGWDIPPGRRQRRNGKKYVRNWGDEYGGDGRECLGCEMCD